MLDQRLHALTAQLTKMSPQQRQKFALANKNDPILVGLAKHINDQANAISNVAKAKQNLPLPSLRPPVVDDVISQMAPNGLAKLPVPPLEQMPDGGIAGQPQEMPMGKPTTYKEGGVVKKYAGATGSWVEEDEPKKKKKSPAENMADEPMGYADQMRRLFLTPIPGTGLKDLPGQVDAVKRGLGSLMPPPNSGGPVKLIGDAVDSSQRAIRDAVRPAPVDMVEKAPKLGGREVVAVPVAPQPAAVPQRQPVGPVAAPTRVAMGAGPVAAAPASGYSLPPMPTAPQFGAIDVPGEFAKAKASLDSGPVAGDEIEALNDAEVEAAMDRRDRLQVEQDEMGEFGTDRERRLKAREEKLNKQESENKGLALLDAGLAMMAGKSPHAMVNIGEGALVGTRRLREGQKMIDEGRERLDDAFSRLEEVRRSEKRANSKEMRDAEAEIDKAMNAGLGRIIDGIQKREDVNVKTATAMLEGGIRDAVSLRDQASNQYRADLSYRGQIESSKIGAEASGYAARLNLQGDQARAAASNRASDAHKAEANDIRWTNAVRQVYGDVAREVQDEARQGGILSRFADNPKLMEQEINRRAVARLQAMRVPESHYSSSAVPADGASGPADFVYDPKTKRLTAPPR